MNGFISHIINRHLFTDVNVAPRLPGRFEPPATPSMQALTGTPAVTETMQAAMHAGTIKSADDQYQRNTDLQIAESAMPFTTISIKKTPFVTGDDNVQHPFIPQAANSSQELLITETNTVELIPPLQYSGQRTAVAAGNNKTQPSGSLIYEPSTMEQQVKEETKRKTPPAVSPDISTSVPVKQGVRPTSSIIPVPLVMPASGRSGAAQRLSGSRLQEQQLPPVIKVSIGRIEVKAVQASTPVKTARVETPKPKMSLDEYLNRRNSTR